MDRIKRKYIARKMRKQRVRKKIVGTSKRPRLAVFKSLKHIYTQIIDDEKGITLVAASTLSPELKNSLTTAGNIDAARKVGQLIANKAKEQKIYSVVFDRGGNPYHGRLQGLAEAAREGGLKF
ncbi:MAG: 50S ribosomal protein L18 [Candidatus Poribacteria bacterium]|nr:50S ribosomal protein L18 [Candidatus Poribacteria bacterium]